MRDIYVRKKMATILEELSQPQYEMEKKEIQRIQKVLSMTKIVFANGKTQKIYTTTKSGKTCELVVDKKLGSCVLEFMPYHEKQKWEAYAPILYLVPFENDEVFDCTLYHEICHLIAIGDWIYVSENTLQHISGLQKMDISFISKKNQNPEYTNVNEELNDWIARFLYEKIENKAYYSNKRPNEKRCHEYISSQFSLNNRSIFPIIGLYFSNQIEKIIEILLQEKYDSMASLEGFFLGK